MAGRRQWQVAQLRAGEVPDRGLLVSPRLLPARADTLAGSVLGWPYILLVSTSQVRQTLKDSAGWWGTLIVGAALAWPVTLCETAFWNSMDARTGPVGAVVILIAVTAVLALLAALALGRIQVPGKIAVYRLTYPLRMAPWKARELVAGGHPDNGSRNRRYESATAFIQDDPRPRPRSDGGASSLTTACGGEAQYPAATG